MGGVDLGPSGSPLDWDSGEATSQDQQRHRPQVLLKGSREGEHCLLHRLLLIYSLEGAHPS